MDDETLESLFKGRENVEDVSFDDCPPQYPEERQDLVCGECGALMELRKSSKFPRPFYGCTKFPECRGTHGAHASGAPLGIPANKDTKRARIRAHAVFDLLWKKHLVKNRWAAYNWMKTVMEIPNSQAHIGQFTTEQCDQLIRLVYRDYPSLMSRHNRVFFEDDLFGE